MASLLKELKQLEIDKRDTVFGYMRNIQNSHNLSSTVPDEIKLLCINYFFQGNKEYIQANIPQIAKWTFTVNKNPSNTFYIGLQYINQWSILLATYGWNIDDGIPFVQIEHANDVSGHGQCEFNEGMFDIKENELCIMTLNTNDDKITLKKKNKSNECYIKNIRDGTDQICNYEIMFKSKEVDIKFIDFECYKLKKEKDKGNIDSTTSIWKTEIVGGGDGNQMRYHGFRRGKGSTEYWGYPYVKH